MVSLIILITLSSFQCWKKVFFKEMHFFGNKFYMKILSIKEDFVCIFIAIWV